MSDNVLIAIIAASAVIISAMCVLGGAVFAYTANNKRTDDRFVDINRRFEDVNRRFDKIDAALALIQGDLKEFFNQIAKIKAHIKLD